MTLNEFARLDGIESLHEDYDDAPVLGAYTSDLLSDVMAHAADGSLLITIQAHRNTVAVASLAGVVAILVCSRSAVADDMLDAARSERIALFRTPLNQFEASCLLGRSLGL
jgi:hypothetical protein